LIVIKKHFSETMNMNFLKISFLFAFSLIINISMAKNALPAYIIADPFKANVEYNSNYTNYGLSKTVFNKAITGYNKMAAKGQLRSERYLTICDMTMSSKKKRFFVIDLYNQKVIYNLRVAHGQGSGDEYATNFSNEDDSHKTSLGFYTTGGDYMGENGFSMKLNGRESGFNDNAEQRAIVMHGSDYVDDDYFKSNNRIGRSWGCPALPTKNVKAVINTIKNGTCLFVYHHTTTYTKKSKYLK
jgi:L,D-transpeptidase catalytic domain